MTQINRNTREHSPMKVGTTARLVQPVVQGEVVARRINAADQIEYQLQWTDAAGEQHLRWFEEAQLEEVQS